VSLRWGVVAFLDNAGLRKCVLKAFRANVVDMESAACAMASLSERLEEDASTKRIHAMAGASLLALLDDISSVLDDVALLTKAASKKTAGVLGDDIALNAQQVTGVVANRELPVVWAVAKGSFVNKLILVPLALAISAFFPVAITPLLMVGGVYLCYEGAEKIIHTLFHRGESAHLDDAPSGATPEHAKIKGAIRTDFILSAASSLASSSWTTRACT
jgi:predicted DNA repair protein MutK